MKFMKLIEANNIFYDKHSQKLFFALMFCIPLKLSASYIFLLPLLLSSLIYQISTGKIKTFYAQNAQLANIWIMFLLVLFLSSFFGINFQSSFSKILQLAVYSFSITIFYCSFNKVDINKALIVLLAAQSIASIHSILEFSYPLNFQRLFIGTVSESGQITLSLFLALGLFASLVSKDKKNFKLILVSLLFTILILIGLLVNLKRGPWGGVLVGGLIFFIIMKRRFIIPFIACLLAPIFAFESFRDRVLNSIDHFFISGGRGDIWEIGYELVSKFPLGIGYGNSSFLRAYSTSVPAELQHFHSNFLNIVVEGGVLSLAIFLWFLFELFKQVALTKSRSYFVVSSICGVIAWQVAGLVEYNMGDSEVMLLAYLTIALLLYKVNLIRKD